jgi:type IV secretory pathway VirB2 component (pilin)
MEQGKTENTMSYPMAKSRHKVGGAMPMTSKTKPAMLVTSKSGQFRKAASGSRKQGFPGGGFPSPKITRTQEANMTQKNKLSKCHQHENAFCFSDTETAGQEAIAANRPSRIRQVIYWSLVAMAMALIITFQPVHADIWATFSNIMKDIYGKLLGISTIVAVTAATIALLVRMISRNQRAVDEATTWLKRIVVTWLILNTLGFIVAYIQPLISGGQYNP